MLVPEIIKKINSDKVVVKYGNDYVLLSHAPAREDGYPQWDETLAFLCNEDGEVKNWTEVAGGSGMNISDVISEISRFGITKRGAYQ
jgi:hypothetical protein